MLLRIFLLIIGLILFSDGFILILQKKIHLGTIIPFFVGLIFLSYALFYAKIQQYLKNHQQLYTFWKISWTVFIIWSISLFGFFLYLHQKTQQNNYIQPVEAIIVLGSGIIQGKASPTLAARLDTAAQFAKTQPNALIIVSGGLDYGEQQTEAEIMSKYLQDQYHIVSSKIALEDQSTSTDLNLKNSQKILQRYGLKLNSPIAIVTSDFHTLRAAAIAQKQGYLHFTTISAPTPLATRYNAWLREYFAYLSGWVLGEY